MAEPVVIFSTHELHPDVTAVLQRLGDYRVASAPTPDAIDRECAGSGIIVVRAPISAEIVSRETKLRALVRHGAGLDMVPLKAATASGVIVANVPGANSVTVAEHAIWSAAALLRLYPRVNAELRGDGWEAGRRYAMHGRELSGRSLGIVGMGNIGRELARIAVHGFGMTVRTHTRSPKTVPDGVEPCALDDLLSNSDIVVLCCPLSEDTRGLIGKTELAAMKPAAILVNVSRGPVVDQAALAALLASGYLGGAALDVFSDQPLGRDSALFDLPNVILTPHMAGITEESMYRMGQGVVAEVTRILDGQKPENLANPEVWSAYTARFPDAQP